MPSKAPSKTKSKPAFDAIDNYFPEGEDLDDDLFADPSESPAKSPSGKTKRKELDGGLGIDEEVSVAKRARVPRVKLDQSRLLSDKGIPALRKRAAQLHLKGKGHEFSDAARLLSFYQLWLDDLFPKAKFLDALAMVEKVGHKTTMHKFRMDWINEGKPKASRADDLDLDPVARERDAEARRQEPTGDAPIMIPDNEDDDDDIYDATPVPKSWHTQTEPGAGAGRRASGGDRDDVPGDDDLEALMAEAEAWGPPAMINTAATAVISKSIFGNGHPTNNLSGADKQSVNPNDDEDANDDEDLEALMAEAEADMGNAGAAGRAATLPAAKDANNKPLQVGNDEDDLDAMMAEAESHMQASVAEPPGPKSAEPAVAQFADGEEAMAELHDLW